VLRGCKESSTMRYDKRLGKALFGVFVVVLLVVSVAGCTSSSPAVSSSPTAAATSANLATPTPSKQAQVSPTPARTPTAKPTPTPKPPSTPTPTPSPSPIQLVGDSATHVYHLPSCSWVHLISPAHLVYFNSAAEAKAAGYRPCEHCHPPS
jgi:Metal binding domain of Ada